MVLSPRRHAVQREAIRKRAAPNFPAVGQPLGVDGLRGLRSGGKDSRRQDVACPSGDAANNLRLFGEEGSAPARFFSSRPRRKLAGVRRRMPAAPAGFETRRDLFPRRRRPEWKSPAPAPATPNSGGETRAAAPTKFCARPPATPATAARLPPPPPRRPPPQTPAKFRRLAGFRKPTDSAKTTDGKTPTARPPPRPRGRRAFRASWNPNPSLQNDCGASPQRI